MAWELGAKVIPKRRSAHARAARSIGFSPSLNLTPRTISATEPSRRRHFLLAHRHRLKTMLTVVLRERQLVVLVVLDRTVGEVLSTRFVLHAGASSARPGSPDRPSRRSAMSRKPDIAALFDR